MLDRRTKFWQDNFSVFAQTKSLESDVNVYMPHSWERRRAVFAKLVDELSAAGVVGEGRAVADIGCGSGMFSRLLAKTGADVVSSDLCFDMLRRAGRESGGEKLMRVNANCERLPFADASFDFVAANGLVTILSDPEPFLAEMGRVLKPGGAAMIETLNGFWLGRVAMALEEKRALPSDIGVLHYTPGALGRRFAKKIGAKRFHTLPIVKLPKPLEFLENALQRVGETIPYLALPASSAFILLAWKEEA